MRCVISLSALLLLALAGAADAEDRGTQAEQQACTPDVFRLCSAYIPNEPAIVACLQSNKGSLSPGCRNIFSQRRASAGLDMTPTGSIGTANANKRSAARPHHLIALLRKSARPRR